MGHLSEISGIPGVLCASSKYRRAEGEGRDPRGRVMGRACTELGWGVSKSFSKSQNLIPYSVLYVECTREVENSAVSGLTR